MDNPKKDFEKHIEEVFKDYLQRLQMQRTAEICIDSKHYSWWSGEVCVRKKD